MQRYLTLAATVGATLALLPSTAGAARHVSRYRLHNLRPDTAAITGALVSNHGRHRLWCIRVEISGNGDVRFSKCRRLLFHGGNPPGRRDGA